MKRFAVSVINWFDNGLSTEIVHAEDWKTALYKHSKMAGDHPMFVFEDDDLVDQKTAKCIAFDQDGMIEVVEIE